MSCFWNARIYGNEGRWWVSALLLEPVTIFVEWSNTMVILEKIEQDYSGWITVNGIIFHQPSIKCNRSTVILGKKVPLLDYTFSAPPTSPDTMLFTHKVPPAAKRTKLPKESHSVPPRRQLGAGWCDPGSSKRESRAVGECNSNLMLSNCTFCHMFLTSREAGDLPGYWVAPWILQAFLTRPKLRMQRLCLICHCWNDPFAAPHRNCAIEGVVLNQYDHRKNCSKIRGSNFNMWSLKPCWLLIGETQDQVRMRKNML